MPRKFGPEGGSGRLRRALADAAPHPFSIDRADAPTPTDPLRGNDSADLAVVGGGFSGLWTALIAKERDPARDVVLFEAKTVGWAASGRNGGFCAASLTHGLGTDLPLPRRDRDAGAPGSVQSRRHRGVLQRYGIDCAFERTGELSVALAEWQMDDLREHHAIARGLGHELDLLDAEAVRAELDAALSRRRLGSSRVRCSRSGRLAWGLREACLVWRANLRAHAGGAHRRWRCPASAGDTTGHSGRRAGGPGTDAARLLRRLRHYLVPVYDYVLVTEPLSASQLAAIGWRRRQGVGDVANQFHYYRLTEDNRILWGGYDAVYYAGGRITPERDQRDATFTVLAEHFFDTFPQLEGVRFTHRWGGVIDTCSRFCAFFGRAYGGRLAYGVGYTGLGVGATRFGARVMLDLLSGEETELTRLKMVRTKPLPFPPEPIRTGVIQLTRWSIAKPTGTRGGATYGCERSTGSASASTPDVRQR